MKEKMSSQHMLFIVFMAIGWVGILNTGWLFTSYYSLAQEALSVSDAAMGILVSITEGMGIWGYLVSGPIADWLKPKRSMDIGTVLMIVGAALLVTLPSGSKPARQSMIDECGLPAECRGTIVGLFSVATVIPGTFMGTIFGNILTQHNNARSGYQIIYLVFAVVGVIGVVGIILFQRLVNKAKAESKAK